MKNNLCKFFIVAIGVCLFGNVGTVSAETNIGGGGEANTHPCSTSRPAACYNAKLGTGSGDSLIQGIRVSVVDESGNRIAGTISVDYIQNSGHVAQITGSRSLKFFTGGKYTKNEVIAGSATGAQTGSAYQATTLGELPTFMNIGPNTAIKDYFNVLSQNGNSAKGEQFLTACGYTKANYTTAQIEKHSLLVEPLTFMRLSYYPASGSVSITNYLGTVTEVSKMMKTDGWVLWNGYFGKMLPLAIYVGNYVDKAGVTQTSRSGLDSISAWLAANKSDYSSEILTKNGTAAGHVWVSDMIDIEDTCLTSPNTLPECCYLPQNKNNLPMCCGLEENKNKPQCNPDLCTFTLDMSCPGGCEDSTNGYIKDIQDWSCIFESRTSSDPNIKDHFYKWGNRYCSVYCREDLSYQFPNGNMSVSAGSHFTIGDTWYSPNWGPVHFEGRSECRTTSDTGSIRWDLFKTDWEAANNTVKSNWDTYQIAIKQDEGIAGATHGSSKDCNSTCDEYHPTYPCAAPSTGTCGGGCKSSSFKGYNMTPKTVYYEGQNVTPSSWCSSFSAPDPQTPSKRSTYLSSVTSRDSLESNLAQCNDWERSYDEFEPVVGLQYTEAIYGGNYYNLSKSLEKRTQTNYFINGDNYPAINSYKKTADTYKYICNTTGSTCVKGSSVSGSKMTYPVNDWLKQFTTKEYDYSLPANVYRYVLKPSGESVNNEPTNGQNYVDLGYSNLPVHYSRVPGSYDIFLQYTSFGAGHNFNKFVFDGVPTDINYGDSLSIYTWLYENGYTYMIEDCHEGGNHLDHNFGGTLVNAGRLTEFLSSGCAQKFGCYDLGDSIHRVTCTLDNSFGESRNYKQLMQCIAEKHIATPVSTVCDTKYDCKYNVTNEILCPPGTADCPDPEGIEVVYRTISLTNPFPGKTANGRDPGDNWNDDSLIEKYITKNRNLQNPEKIYYDREPMYEIELTPLVIKEIRAYNRTQSSNNRGGYADFELDCVIATGKECKSNFIRDIFNNNFVSNRCGMSSNWNSCANSDESRG